MQVSFEHLSSEHRKDTIDILNYYIENSFAAYPDQTIPYEFYDKLLEMVKEYPAFSIKVKEKTIGFCFLRAYNPFPTFRECAEISYFIDKDFTGKGIGKIVLHKLEAEARKKGIKTILASIASENYQSLVFHKKNGFKECGRFEKIIRKRGKQFDIIWMQKMLDF
jgi:L-amino acid N-acyltransferase YncA